MRFAKKEFSWVGEGTQVIYSRKQLAYYRGFLYDGEEYEIGDYVLIRNDDSVDPEDICNCYVAQIKKVYDTGDLEDSHQAVVQWFSRASELQKVHVERLKHCGEVSDFEVVEDNRPQWSPVADAETIFGKCVVKIVGLNFDYNSFESDPHEDKPIFFCRYKLISNKLSPIIKDESEPRTPKKTPRLSVFEKTNSKKDIIVDDIVKTPSKMTYEAIPTGTPEYPKVLLKRLDDRILENRTNGVRVIIARPDAKTIDDIAETLHSNLVLKSAEKSYKRPIIHSLSVSSRDTSEESSHRSVPIDNLCNPPQPLPSQQVQCLTPKKSSSPESAKDIVIYSGSKFRRNTPRKAALVNSTPVTTPKKRSSSAQNEKELSKTPKSAKKSSPSRRVESQICTRSTPAKSRNKTPCSNSVSTTPNKRQSSAKRTLQFPMVKKEKETQLTRSGRKVKPVDYKSFFDNHEVKQPVITNSQKKVAKFIRSTYSDESGSEFEGAQSSSSDEEMCVSDASDEEKSFTPSRKTGVKRTPKSNRKKQVELVIPNRKTPLKGAQNVLEESRLRLHVSAVPKSLPCREEEFSDIYSFVKGCLCAQTGGCMYISGVPGTGKTATVHEVIRTLEAEREDGDIPLFNFVEVNAMWMTDPYQCYVHIYKSLTGKTIASQQAANLLEKRFTEPGPKKDAVILLVDELDRLWTRKQTVMYNIFDWPSKKHSKLIVVAIANTMDLPERLMMNRISSRLGLTRKTFQPYTFRQLQEIIMNRIQELEVFDPDAVQFVARKVAAVSGDARRALDICRHATEVAERVAQPITKKKGNKIIVGMEHVDEAIQQMFSSPVISAIKGSSKLCKLFLEGMLSEFTRTGTEETVLIKVSKHIISCCNFEGFYPPSSADIFDTCTHLAATHLILVDNFQNDIYMKLRLSVSPDDVGYALTGKG